MSEKETSVNSTRHLSLAASICVLVIGCSQSAPVTPAAQTTPSTQPAPIPTTAPTVGPTTSPIGLPPDGTWEVVLSTEELVAAGAPDATRGGVYTWTFADGRGTIDVQYDDDGDDITCSADLEAVGDVVRFTYDDGPCGGEVDEIRWAMEDDGLHLSLVETNAPLEENQAYLEAKPWQLVP
jgi:hypothetical protein